MTIRRLTMAAGGVALGLFVGATATRALAQHPPAATAIRYQYKCLTSLPVQMFKPDAIAALNREGADGWRLLDGLSGQNHLSGGDQYCFVKAY